MKTEQTCKERHAFGRETPIYRNGMKRNLRVKKIPTKLKHLFCSALWAFDKALRTKNQTTSQTELNFLSRVTCCEGRTGFDLTASDVLLSTSWLRCEPRREVGTFL